MKDIANFLFEVGMLKKTPRTGLQFLGSGDESVAEHIFRVVIIGYTLSRLVGNVDEAKIVKMCFLHDLPEARTGDLNYVNKKYVTAYEDKAVKELARTLPFGDDIESLIDEFNRMETLESKLANDADQLELILQLKEYHDLGNRYADEWIDYALKRLTTDVAKELAKTIRETDSSFWWFKEKGDWWVTGGNPKLGNNDKP
ncbi:MAG TPA: HD domain-containing protein [Thermodesulfobacteriota bacterium]|nr:HD domain-containing protein [Thermodesulfobacteriota bacterium]